MATGDWLVCMCGHNRLADVYVWPQVIGLTASPGVGPQSTIESVVSHIQQLCYIMDVERICTVQDDNNKQELQYFINVPKHGKLLVLGDRESWNLVS